MVPVRFLPPFAPAWGVIIRIPPSLVMLRSIGLCGTGSEICDCPMAEAVTWERTTAGAEVMGVLGVVVEVSPAPPPTAIDTTGSAGEVVEGCDMVGEWGREGAAAGVTTCEAVRPAGKELEVVEGVIPLAGGSALADWLVLPAEAGAGGYVAAVEVI